MNKLLIYILAVLLCAASLPAVEILQGKTCELTATAKGTQPFSYQWKKDGVDVYGAKAATLYVTNMTAEKAGAYTCTISNSAGSTVTNAVPLTYKPIEPPTEGQATGVPK